jgi:hypothetical protein
VGLLVAPRYFLHSHADIRRVTGSQLNPNFCILPLCTKNKKKKKKKLSIKICFKIIDFFSNKFKKISPGK